jgi:hypothetical protein
VTAPAAPPDLSALAVSLDAALGVEPAPTTIVRPRAGPLARLGLALEPWPGLAAWIAGSALDAVLLHRHWALRDADVPAGVGVLANHDAFDRRLGFGRSPELAAVLGLALGDPLGERDGFPLATLGDGAPRPPPCCAPRWWTRSAASRRSSRRRRHGRSCASPWRAR